MYKALVTGGTRGIGLAIAERLRKAGHDVITCARDEGADLRCDVTSRSDVERMREQVGAVDILVNNAGGTGSAPFLKIDEAEWDRLIQLNLKSVYYCTQAFLPAMLEKKFGRIVNIASVAGKVGVRYVAGYVAAKHAVIGLTRALAVEYADKGITVNAVCPSFVDTPMLRRGLSTISKKTKKTEEEILETFRSRNPQHRLVTPEEVATAVQFVIDTPAVNGQSIALCGGETF
jgi:NAD(P)-dependent dehydrogenase (short-subunit alcohol dehydrogenase family)